METTQIPTGTYICVDVETAGPSPGQYSLLSIGACTVFEAQSSFYIELKPVNGNIYLESLSVSQLSIARLVQEGVEPNEAMTRFDAWIETIVPPGQKPIFVAFNAAFDWMFISHYFYTYLGRNPFGHAALDIKSYFMGLTGVHWGETSMRKIAPNYLSKNGLDHHALQDALDQAEIFRQLLAQAKRKSLDRMGDQLEEEWLH